MSWNGPVAGAAPYQQPPYVNGQPAFNQPQTYQYGQQLPYMSGGQPFPLPNAQPRPPQNHPPKKKGNPIITRYPPPPGYRGPAQPQGFGAQQQPHPYQQNQTSYQQGPLANSAYPNQGYQPPVTQGYPIPAYGQGQQKTAYPSNGYPQAPSNPWSQQSHQAYSQPPNYSGNQSYAPAQSSYPSYPVAAPPTTTSQQSWTQTQSWQQQHPSNNHPTKYQPGSISGPASNSQGTPDPDATPTPTSACPATVQTAPSVLQPQSASSEPCLEKKNPLFMPGDDWDFEFDGAIWPKANEPVDPNFSLGVIIWRPAKQATRALPSNFADAEEQALKPPAEKLGNGESVSVYFTAENSHEAFLDVRQTDEWYRIRKDPVFVVFTDEDMARSLIPIEECLALRDRPDEPVEEAEEEDEVMHDASWNVMDNLEQALSGNGGEPKSLMAGETGGSAKDQEQEDILAKLGVTGTAKPPSDDPISISFPQVANPPSFLPEKPTMPGHVRTEKTSKRAQSYGGFQVTSRGHAQQRPFASVTSASELQAFSSTTQEYDPWNPSTTSSRGPLGPIQDRSRGSPARSEGSNHTAFGSDFESETLGQGVEAPTQSALLKRSDSSNTRKRSHEEDADPAGGKGRQTDEHIKRKRLSQANFAYRRR